MAKLNPLPLYVAPRGKGDPAVVCAVSSFIVVTLGDKYILSKTIFTAENADWTLGIPLLSSSTIAIQPATDDSSKLTFSCFKSGPDAKPVTEFEGSARLQS